MLNVRFAPAGLLALAGLIGAGCVTDVNRRPVGSVEEMMAVIEGRPRALALDLRRGHARMVLVIR